MCIYLLIFFIAEPSLYVRPGRCLNGETERRMRKKASRCAEMIGEKKPPPKSNLDKSRGPPYNWMKTFTFRPEWKYLYPHGYSWNSCRGMKAKWYNV